MTIGSPAFDATRSFFSTFRLSCIFAVFEAVGLLLLLPFAVQANPHSEEGELAIKNLEVVPGLEVDLFASDPLFFNPVAFSIDEKGRFFIAETHRYKEAIFDIWAASQEWKDADASFRAVEDRAAFLAEEFSSDPDKLTKHSEVIRILEDRDGDGRADHSAVFAEGFNQTVSGTAAGVLARKGEVWFACIPDLWRLEIGDADDATARERLHTGYGVHIGVSGHDLHGLVMGPDGKLYFSVGDRGARVRTQEGSLLDYPDTGAIFRCDPDGSNLEVFAFGLRNPQELVFDRYGNLWAHDNDTSGPDMSRVLHVVEGGDYGWRYSYQFMTGFGPWVQEEVWAGGIDDVLPNAGHGAKGPSGLAYYPGVGLPERYDHHFIACDFPQGVWSFTSQPKGASYEIAGREKFLWNAGPTDVEFGPDGDVYISDWGRSYLMPDGGRIYRMFDPDQVESSAKAELKMLLAEGMEDRPLEELRQLLGHADMRVRTAAQFELIERASASAGAMAEVSGLLQEVARESENLLARLHALWALEATLPEGAKGTLGHLLEDADDEIRAQAAKVIGAAEWSALAPALAGRLRDTSPRVRFYAATSLGKLFRSDPSLQSDGLRDQVLGFIRENDDADAYLRHAGVMALLDSGNANFIEQAADDASPAVRRAALLGMRRLEDPGIVRFLQDPDPGLRYEAARAINDVPINEAMPELAVLLAEPDCHENVVTRAINANFRLGGARNAQAIREFAARENAPEYARVEALRALGDWAEPASRDRVVGLWRPLESRDGDPARAALESIAPGLLDEGPDGVRTALVESAAQLKSKGIAVSLLRTLTSPETPAALRRAISVALIEIDSERAAEVMEIALADDNLSVRRAGVELLDRVEVPNASGLLGTLLATETDLRLSQAALATLGRLEDDAADAVLADLLDDLLSGDVRPQLHLDLLEASAKRSSPAVKERMARYAESLGSEDRLAAFRPTLVGGDPKVGGKVFNERDAVGCLRCHAVGGRGGNVGPDLAGIGKKRSREYLLESILEPNKHFAPGFERVTLVLSDGKSVTGVVDEESPDQITLLTPDVEVVSKNQIEERHTVPSAMPKGLEQHLTRHELRDLIEFMAELK